jgi:hippurate hydrolase
MPVIAEIAAFHEDMTAWRRDLHMHPELGYQEARTAERVAAELTRFGVDVHRGLGRTGVVGTLRSGNSGPTIALRADMDALPMEEKNDLPHRSRNAGRMHACGHDGHTTMLLGAARYLAATRRFAGTVHFIFQPAEEGLGGAKAMMADGLFEKFPADAVYGLHNAPRRAAGTFATRSGPLMAASADFDVQLRGRGAHAARPENGVDPIVAAAHLVTSLQTVVSRTVSPLDNAVLSTTQIHGGTAYNVIPEEVKISGNCRAYRPEVMDRIEAAIARIANGAAATFGAQANFEFRRKYPPLINHQRETMLAADAAAAVVGEDKVDRNGPPRMASEDFSFMLQALPGAFVFLGAGDGEGIHDVHSPYYDFNDAILPIGASYFARLVELNLPQQPAA